MADGVWLMAGGSHHSVAVEFEDEVAVIAPVGARAGPVLAVPAGGVVGGLHEKILVEADLYTPPGPGRPLPDRPNASARSLYRNVQRLGLDVETIVPIHGRPGPWSQFAEWVEAAQ